MKIIIVGCGKVGLAIVAQLSKEKHDVTIVDVNKQNVETTTNLYDVFGVVGNGASAQVLEQAGIADADLLIAMTGNDELNMLSCLIAQKIGHCKTISRIHNPEYNDELNIIKEELGLAMTVNSEQMAAEEIARLIRFPSAQKIESFAKGKVDIIKYKIPENSKLDGCRVMDLAHRFLVKMLICAVEHDNEVFIPNGEYVLHSGDLISFIATGGMATELFMKLGLGRRKISTCMIVGGGGVSYYLAKLLLRMNVRVTIIDKNRDRCNFLSDELDDEAIVICGDAVDQSILDEEGIRDMDAVCAMTNLDETNILLSLYARENSKAKLITKVHRLNYGEIISGLDLDSVICPKNIVADNIIQYVRAMQNSLGSNVETLYKIIEDRAEALEFYVKKDSPVVGIPLENLEMKEDLIVAGILHGRRAEIPHGKSIIRAGDSVVVVTTREGLNDISDILK